MTRINVELVTPEELLFSNDVDMVVIPGQDGDFGVLKDHVPMISSIRPGVIVLETAGKEQKIFVEGGFVEVTADRCTILAKKATDLANVSDAEASELLKDI